MSPERSKAYALMGVPLPSNAGGTAALGGQGFLTDGRAVIAQMLASDAKTVHEVAAALGVPLSMLPEPSGQGRVSALSGSTADGVPSEQAVLILASNKLPGSGGSSAASAPISDAAGYALAAQMDRAARLTPVVIDFDGQLLTTATVGNKAPAAGWIHGASWTPGRGLVAQVSWTAAAEKMLASNEYRYLQPQLRTDPSGKVVEVLFASLTNVPRRFAVPLF